MIKLSKTSKLGTPSWSLQAIDTCPGSISDDGKTLVNACSGCYATQGMYNFPVVKAVRAANREDWKRDDFVVDMVHALRKVPFMRLFDSGDMYDLKLAHKWYQIFQQSPQCQFWLPTRMYKFTKFASVLQGMQALPNVMVRNSSDDVDGSYTQGVHGSCIIPTADTVTDAFICNAPAQGGKCLTCRACYSKEIPVIAYIAHGIKMKRVINIHKS